MNIEIPQMVFINIDIGDCDYRALIVYTHIPEEPGCLTGLPENCYPPTPAETEIKRVQLEVADNVWADLNRDYFHVLDEQLKAFIDSHAPNEFAI